MDTKVIKMRRRTLILVGFVLLLMTVALACQAEPQERVVVQTVVVPGEVQERIVVQTVVVPGEVRERIVVQTVVVPVETIITIIATPIPAVAQDLTPIRGGILRRYQAGDTGIMIPFLTKATEIRYFVFDPLIEYDDLGQLRPNLAESWEVASDSRSITFNLRQDVKWHDGVSFTADDVLFTLDTIRNPDTLTRYRAQLTVDGNPITWRAPDDFTVVLDLPQPFSPVMGSLSEILMIPKHALEGTEDINTDPFNRAPIGTGPFRVLNYVADSNVETEGAPLYHNGVPYLDKMFNLFFPDPDAAAAAVLTAQMDTMWAYPEQQGQFEKPGSANVVRTYAYWQAITLGFNQKHPALADKRVREAIRWAIKSKSDWSDVVTRGRGEAADVFLAIASPLNQYNPPGSLTPFTNDQQKAMQLLDDAGWKVGAGGIREKDGQKLTLATPWYNGLIEYGEGVVILQEWLKEVGIDVVPQPVERSLRNDLRDNANTAEGWVDYAMEVQEWPHVISQFEPDWSAELACSAAPPAGQNYMSYCNPEVDRLLEVGKSTFDPVARQAAYRSIQELLNEDVAAIPLYFVFDALVTSSRIQGIPNDSPAARYFFRRFPERIWLSR